MITSAYKCGCPIHNPQQMPEASVLYSKPTNLNSCSDSEEDDNSCGCGSDSESLGEETSKIVSEIEQKGLPYKEIEAIINDNRMVVRIQKEKAKPEYDPPCECIETRSGTSENSFANSERKSNVIFQKANEGCRTISVYPHPDPKKPDLKSPKSDKFDKRDDSRKGGKDAVAFPTVNPEENPNIFVLKIKRKCEGQDKKHNLDLEFRAPRPWRKKDYFL